MSKLAQFSKHPPNWGPIDYSKEVEFVKVSRQNYYYKFIRGEMGDLQPTEIYRIQNPYLWGCYQLKFEECESRNSSVEEYELWHATDERNVDSIAQGNFNWRRTKRSRFGCGVSFSDDPDYANQYCNFDCGKSRAMILAKVIVGKTCPGKRNMQIPAKGCDTSCGNNGKVYVKFSDHEFYPQYVAYYDDYDTGEEDDDEYYSPNYGSNYNYNNYDNYNYNNYNDDNFNFYNYLYDNFNDFYDFYNY